MLYEDLLVSGVCDFTSTKELDESQWLDLRRTGIGGSDAGAIMGLNKYSTPLSVYLAKKNLSSFTGNNATKRGHILENPVRHQCRLELGIRIQSVPGMFTSFEHPFMNANFDGLCFISGKKVINGTELSGLGGHEIKTSSFGDNFTADEVPDHYYCQCQHYMAVTNLKWFILSVYILGQDIVKHYVIPRNDEFIQNLIEKETDFWENYVQKDVIPSPTGNDYESDLVDGLVSKTVKNVELPETVASIVAAERNLAEQIKALETKQTALKEQIKLEIFKASGITEEENEIGVKANVGDFKLSWTIGSRSSVDSDKLKKDGLYDNYLKKSITKTLRISGGK